MAKTKNPNIVDETSAERFIRLAEYRTNKALERINQLAHLSSSLYDKTDQQIDQIESALYTAVEQAMAKLRHVKAGTTKFALNS